MRLYFCFILSLFSLEAIAQKTTLTVRIEGIKAEEGKILLALYTREAEFLSDEIYLGKEAYIQNGKAIFLLENVPYGVYAISTYFDKNENGELDTNFLGIPKEPYGFSMNPESNFGPPSFDQAAFRLSSPSDTITITY